MVTALLVSLLIAFPLGIISAIKQYSKLDYTVTAFSFLGLSMPSFWLGLMLIIFFAVLPRQWHDNVGLSWMPYLPTGDIADIGKHDDILNRVYHLILPVTVLAFIQIAGWSRFVRASMLEVMRQDYVRTAWAKGLGFRRIILRHALRNSLVPIITIFGLALPGLVQGAIITEAVFAYAGMGRLFLDAVTQLDIPLAMAFLMIVTMLVVASNMLADMLYAVVDPRIRYS
jgi:peptide/nickel transport system permease protein